MIELSMVRDLVAIFGVIAGFSYYVLTVRATRRNQDLQLETRQSQLFHQVTSPMMNVQAISEYMEMLNWEWDDYNDFEMKYGSDNNLREYAIRTRLWMNLIYISREARMGLLDIEHLYNGLDVFLLFCWFKFKDVIFEQRKRYYTETYMAEWEYIVNEIIKYREQIGDPWTPPTTLSRYIPDQ